MARQHDIGYKKLFSNPKLVKELIVSFVDEPWVKELDFDSLERLDKSFITDEFMEKESDLIYRVNFKGKELFIYLLIEFQSTVDRFMALRMLRYITEFYDYLRKAKKQKTLPAVFPLMLYNGEDRWSAPVSIGELIEQSVPKKYMPEFAYYKIAENEFSKEFLLGIRNMVSAIFYIETIHIDEIADNLRKIVSLLKEERPEEISLFVKWIEYFFRGTRDPVPDKIYQLEEAQEMLATSLKKHNEKLIEQGVKQGVRKGVKLGVRQGVQQGIKKGVQQGIKQGVEQGKLIDKQEMLIMLISKKFGITEKEKKLIKKTDNAQKLNKAIEAVVLSDSKEVVLKGLTRR